jgi:hypothetical protein|tara:strand:+ start:609 stop:881 length:273 start_codon:yes stop_codon:yes gene_type:complete
MAITKEIVIGKIEIVSKFKHIQVRTDTIIKEDDKEISKSFNRHIVTPDISTEDLENEHTEVQAIANSGIWTQEVKDAWVAHKDEQEATLL